MLQQPEALISLNSIISFIAGGAAGFYLEKALDQIAPAWRNLRMRHYWRRVNRIWSSFQDLAPGFEVVQGGWERTQFSEKSVAVTLEGDYFAPEVIEAH